MSSANEAPVVGSTIEVNDCVFCSHRKELCDECDFDGREENDGFFGLKNKPREPLELPNSRLTKDGKWQCEKHGTPDCNTCYNWKKTIVKLQKETAKAGR